MNTTNVSAPWHLASFERFTGELLPELLARRLSLEAFLAERRGDGELIVSISVRGTDSAIHTISQQIPAPDAEGIFHYNGRRWVVSPVASEDDLEKAAISCVGEQLFAEIEGRLGEAPADLPWDEDLLRTWVPLEKWVRDFLSRAGKPFEETNWLSAKTQLRRPHPRDSSCRDTTAESARSKLRRDRISVACSRFRWELRLPTASFR